MKAIAVVAAVGLMAPAAHAGGNFYVNPEINSSSVGTGAASVLAAAPVCDRSWVGTRALRADLEGAPAIDPRNAAAAGPNRVNVHGR